MRTRFTLPVAAALAAALAADVAGAQADTSRAAAGGDLPAPYIRRAARKGAGRFMTGADIAKLRPTGTLQLLTRVSGGSLRDMGNGEQAIVGRRGNTNPFGAPVENALCTIGVAVNEARVPPGFDLRTLNIDEIVALEFYNGPSTIPPELGGTSADGARCGLFVLWVKGR
jgi:hypothetical protein